jgi:LEA14-like dessication related protein
MKKYATKYSFIAICICLSLLSATCKDAIQSPEYLGTADTAIKNLSFGGNSTIQTNLLYNNPNNFGISIKQTDLKIYIEDIYVADAEQPNPIQVKAKSKFTFPIVAKFSAMKLLGNALSMLGKKEFRYKIEGTAKLGKGNIFIKVPVKVSDVYVVK